MKRPTVQEHQDRVDYCRELIARGLSFGKVKIELRAKYGEDLHSRACGRLYLKAKRDLAESVAKLDREALVGALLEHLQDIMADTKSRPVERVRAIETVVDILGLAAPSKQEVSVAMAPQRKPISIDWEAMKKMRAELFSQRRPALPNGGQQ